MSNDQTFIDLFKLNKHMNSLLRKQIF